MRRILAALLTIIILTLVFAQKACGQRRISPVGAPVGVSSQERNDSISRRNLVRQTDSHGNVVFVDTITGKEFIDSTAMKVSTKMIYPLMSSVIVGVNIWDPAMRLLGQKYGLGSVWAMLSLHNRYLPFIELGLSTADDTPDDGNYTYKSPVAPFFKIGINYNFLYNSTPDYQLYAGIHYGYSRFKFSIDNVTVDEGYWDDPSHFNIPDCTTWAGYMEFMLGLKVKIVKQFSLGWNVGYHTILHEGKAPHGKPMIIPGYGKRQGGITAGFSIIYTFPLNKTAPVAVTTSETTD